MNMFLFNLLFIPIDLDFTAHYCSQDNIKCNYICVIYINCYISIKSNFKNLKLKV